ncbi:MAG: LacI family DNA-binding transcriptional regulator [Spirochaetota bacterium]
MHTCARRFAISVTIKDIAKLANVSHTTVSRSLNDSPLISGETKDRVVKIAKELNYEANSNARSLSTQKTGIVGLIYELGLEKFGSSAYVNELFIEIRHNLETLQLDTILLEAINPDTLSSNTVRLIRQKKVDGFLLVHSQISVEDVKALHEYNIPAVQIHFKPQFIDISRLDYFLTDNVKGGYLATKHLIERGAKNILTLTCSPDIGSEFSDRTEGYFKALTEEGIVAEIGNVFELDTKYLSAYTFIFEHLSLVASCDAIFAQADILASACIAALKEHKIVVPRDIMVVGYDDSFYSTLVPPFITTIHQPQEELSVKACNRILDLLKTDPVKPSKKEQEMIEPYLIVRETT